MAKKQKKEKKQKKHKAAKVKKGRRRQAKQKQKQKQQAVAAPPPSTQNPFKLVMYHLVRIPWYIVKTFDWLFTLFTALLVYLSK